ncbi:hypothetical protein D9M68_777640 [compost metagenome]
MRALDPQRAEFGDQHRNQHQQHTVHAQRRHILPAQQKHAELGDKPGEDRQRPIEQQGHRRHADDVVRQPRGEIAAHQPQHEEHQHRGEDQVLTPQVAEQLQPWCPPYGPEQQRQIKRPADDLTGWRE